MMKSGLILAASVLLLGACTIDGPEPGSTGVTAEMERQERIRQQERERQRLCGLVERDSEYHRHRCRQGER